LVTAAGGSCDCNSLRRFGLGGGVRFTMVTMVACALDLATLSRQFSFDRCRHAAPGWGIVQVEVLETLQLSEPFG